MRNQQITEPSLQHLGAVPFPQRAPLPVLNDRRRPNEKKIAEWLRQGVLAPVKRGLYLRGESRRTPCLPLVADDLCGPSRVSLGYALE